MLIASSLALVMSLAPPAHAFSFGKKSAPPPPPPPPVAEAPEAPEEKAPSGISSSAKSYQLSGDVGLEYEAATNQTYNVRDKYAKKAPKQYKKFERKEREEAAPRPKKASGGGGFSLPSFSLPSFDMPAIPDFGGGDDGEAPAEE